MNKIISTHNLQYSYTGKIYKYATHKKPPFNPKTTHDIKINIASEPFNA